MPFCSPLPHPLFFFARGRHPIPNTTAAIPPQHLPGHPLSAPLESGDLSSLSTIVYISLARIGKRGIGEMDSCWFAGVCMERGRESMKSTSISVDRGGEMQEYDGLADFDSLVDFSSVWEGFRTADGSATTVKEEFGDSCATSESTNSHYVAENNIYSWQRPWGSCASPTPSSTPSTTPAQPDYMPTLKSRKKRSIRDILREVTVSEETLQSAVASLGGGAQGLQVLMDHVNFWVSKSPDADVVATIRNGIVDLGMLPTKGFADSTPPCTDFPNRSTCATSVDEHADRGVAFTRALRKSNMARQRGHPARAHRGQANGVAGKGAGECGHQSTRGQWRSGARYPQSWMHDLDLEVGSASGKGHEFLFQKALRASDVSSLGRIVLPKKDAERHFPYLLMRKGMTINLEDYHSGTFWTVRYRFWPNNKSRMYLLENTGGFVSYHHLQEGDLLLCYRNGQGGYVIRAQKLPPSVKAPAKGLGLKGTRTAREVTEPAGMKSTMNVDAFMRPTSLLTEEDQSTIGTIDLANSSMDSL